MKWSSSGEGLITSTGRTCQDEGNESEAFPTASNKTSRLPSSLSTEARGAEVPSGARLELRIDLLRRKNFWEFGQRFL